MNESFRLLINNALKTAQVLPFALVWKRTLVMPATLFVFSGIIFLSLFFFYRLELSCVFFNASIFAMTLIYGCYFSIKIIYRLVLVSLLPDGDVFGLPCYVNSVLTKSFYVFLSIQIVILTLSILMLGNLFASGFAMLLHLVLSFLSIRLIYSFVLLDVQRQFAPILGAFTSGIIGHGGE